MPEIYGVYFRYTIYIFIEEGLMNKKFLSIAIVGFMLLSGSQKSLSTQYLVMKDRAVDEPVTLDVFYTSLSPFSSCPSRSITLDKAFEFKQFEVPLTCSIDYLTVNQIDGLFSPEQIKKQLKKGWGVSNNFVIKPNSQEADYPFIIELLSSKN